MIVRYGILSNIRARGRTALFALLILLLTLTLALALGVRAYCGAVLRQGDESYRSIALIEYMGAEYPDGDEPDEAARAAAAELDERQILAVDGVTAWSRADQRLAQVEGYTRVGGELPYPNSAVLAVHSFVEIAEQYRLVEVAEPEEEAYVVELWGSQFLGYRVYEAGKEPAFYPCVSHEDGSEDYVLVEFAEGEERSTVLSAAELPERYVLVTRHSELWTDFEVVGVREGDLHPSHWQNQQAPALYYDHVLENRLFAYRLTPVAYTAIVGRILYSSEYSGGVMVDLAIDGTDFVPEAGRSYLLHGEFLEQRVRSLPSFQVTAFEEDPAESPWATYQSGDETLFTNSVFVRYAEKYATANNYVRLEQAAVVEDLPEFQQGLLVLSEGHFPTADEPDGCVVSGDMAAQLALSVGDTVRVTELAGTAENRFAVTKTAERYELTVTGIALRNEDYCGWIWTGQRREAALLYGYRLGTASLENAKGAEAARQLQSLMPENVRVTLLDQGYQAAAKPFAAMRRTATAVLLACAAGVAAVLTLFAFLFVGRQQETVRILTALGTPGRKITRWLLSGAAVIAGTASALGGAAGLLCLPWMLRRVEESAAAAQTGGLPYSDASLGLTRELEHRAQAPYAAASLAALGVLILGLLLCALFLRRARRSAAPRRGRSRVRVPRGRTSTAGSGALRFALLSMRRGGLRSALVPLVSVCLTLLILVLGGTRQRWERELRETRESAVIEGQVTSLNGRQYTGLVLPAHKLRALAGESFVEDFSVSYGLPYWLEGEMPTFASNEYGAQLEKSWIRSRPELIALNSLRAAGEFYFIEPEVTWLDGWDESFLAEEGYEPLLLRAFGLAREESLPTVVSEEFLLAHGLRLGDSFTVLADYPLRVSGLESVRISVGLRAVGSFRRTGGRDYLYVPLAAYIDPQWLFGEEDVLDGARAPLYLDSRESVETYLRATASFSSCRFRLRPASQLEQARTALQRGDYAWVGRSSGNRVAVILRDGAYLELTEGLERNLALGRLAFPMIFALVALLGLVISWLMIHGRKPEFAVMRGLGAGKGRVFLSFFLEQAALCVLGCAAGGLALLALGGGDRAQRLALVAYLLCYLLGCAVSVLLVGRMNLMELLSERE